MTKIIVDSTCDLPDELMKKYDIKTLPNCQFKRQGILR